MKDNFELDLDLEKRLKITTTSDEISSHTPHPQKSKARTQQTTSKNIGKIEDPKTATTYTPTTQELTQSRTTSADIPTVPKSKTRNKSRKKREKTSEEKIPNRADIVIDNFMNEYGDIIEHTQKELDEFWENGPKQLANIEFANIVQTVLNQLYNHDSNLAEAIEKNYSRYKVILDTGLFSSDQEEVMRAQQSLIEFLIASNGNSISNEQGEAMNDIFTELYESVE